MPILDLNGSLLTSANYFSRRSDSKEFTLLIEPTASATLTADLSDDLTVFAKTEPGDSYQDIEATPLDLSAFANTQKVVFMKIDTAAAAVIGAGILNIILNE